MEQCGQPCSWGVESRFKCEELLLLTVFRWALSGENMRGCREGALLCARHCLY